MRAVQAPVSALFFAWQACLPMKKSGNQAPRKLRCLSPRAARILASSNWRSLPYSRLGMAGLMLCCSRISCASAGLSVTTHGWGAPKVAYTGPYILEKEACASAAPPSAWILPILPVSHAGVGPASKSYEGFRAGCGRPGSKRAVLPGRCRKRQRSTGRKPYRTAWSDLLSRAN